MAKREGDLTALQRRALGLFFRDPFRGLTDIARQCGGKSGSALFSSALKRYVVVLLEPVGEHFGSDHDGSEVGVRLVYGLSLIHI